MIQKNNLVKFRKDKEKVIVFIKGWSFGINESAYEIVNFFDKPKKINELFKYLQEKYNISNSLFKEKVELFIENMIRQEILIKTDN